MRIEICHIYHKYHISHIYCHKYNFRVIQTYGPNVSPACRVYMANVDVEEILRNDNGIIFIGMPSF
jgi:hypothetical protein